MSYVNTWPAVVKKMVEVSQHTNLDDVKDAFREAYNNTHTVIESDLEERFDEAGHAMGKILSETIDCINEDVSVEGMISSIAPMLNESTIVDRIEGQLTDRYDADLDHEELDALVHENLSSLAHEIMKNLKDY